MEHKLVYGILLWSTSSDLKENEWIHNSWRVKRQTSNLRTYTVIYCNALLLGTMTDNDPYNGENCLSIFHGYFRCYRCPQGSLLCLIQPKRRKPAEIPTITLDKQLVLMTDITRPARINQKFAQESTQTLLYLVWDGTQYQWTRLQPQNVWTISTWNEITHTGIVYNDDHNDDNNAPVTTSIMMIDTINYAYR
jgi:hypothetical protein